jgi:hypothetical protein
MHTNIQVLSETEFSTRSVQRGYTNNLSKNIADGREQQFRENLTTEAEE